MDYHEGQRALQDQFDTRRLADRLAGVAGDMFGEAFRSFIESCDMFFIATADPDGFPDCSYKGGDPGFVRVVDPPVPDWKRDAWFDGTLAADDPAHDPQHPSAPAILQF